MRCTNDDVSAHICWKTPKEKTLFEILEEILRQYVLSNIYK